MSINKPELETLEYKPNLPGREHDKTCECLDCQANYGIGKRAIQQSASAPPATLGFNSHVIKPETRANKGEDVSQPLENLKIIEEIEGLISQVNDKIHKLTFTHESSNITRKQTLWLQALEDIDLFQKTTLFELRKAFE